MKNKIIDFVERLSEIDCIPNSTAPFENPYKREACKYNLEQYLLFLSGVHPKFMLVGEAPGYRGCQLTGIPFTDEIQLLNSSNNFALGDWARHPDTGNQKENSATVIWEGLREKRLIPIMWNAFPFHPYNEGKVKSNRTPNAAEIKWGKDIIKEICELFDIKVMYAVGKKAQGQLGLSNDFGIRHPSYGGKEKCLEGLSGISV